MQPKLFALPINIYLFFVKNNKDIGFEDRSGFLRY